MLHHVRESAKKESKCVIVIVVVIFSACTYYSSKKTSNKKCRQTSTTSRFTSKENVSSSAEKCLFVLINYQMKRNICLDVMD